MFWFIFIGVFVCYSVYAIFPNGQNLRPTITGVMFFKNCKGYLCNRYTYQCSTQYACVKFNRNTYRLDGVRAFKRAGLRLTRLFLWLQLAHLRYLSNNILYWTDYGL